ncbi:MAG: pyridoxamine kinase [Clostridia bacterium]|nr:pyridoxamine kinase [Clostridia bacterium]
MKRILTVQDISCVGKCSGTVAVPVLSALGVEAALLPTAVLSTHTGFKGFTFRDLTDDIPSIGAHWKDLGLTFEAFYSGYLGSIRQVNMVRDLFTELKRAEDLILIDPVMADYGKFYTGFGPEFAKEMCGLCAIADVVVPNLTEACFLDETPFRADMPLDDQKELAKRLAARGMKKIVLTGVQTGPETIGAMLYDSDAGTFEISQTGKIPAAFHGTGDLFASALLGGIMNGMSVAESMDVAVGYIAECMRITLEDPDHVDYGVEFEKATPWLLKRSGLFG